MDSSIEIELERIEREIVRLDAQREVLLKLLGKPLGSRREAESHTLTGRRRETPLRPKNPQNTDAIIAAVHAWPGATLPDIARHALKALNGDLDIDASEDQLRKLYNVAYGLLRRGRLKKVGENGVALAP